MDFENFHFNLRLINNGETVEISSKIIFSVFVLECRNITTRRFFEVIIHVLVNSSRFD